MISVVSSTLPAEDRREAETLRNLIFGDLFVATLWLTNDEFTHLQFRQLETFEH